MPEFTGFPAGTIKFLRDLSKNNRREWFQENRSRYEDFFLKPALEFIAAIQKPLEKISPMLVAEPKKVGGSLMRIYRDTRFSKGKEPYKTNIGIHFRHKSGCDVHAPGFYFHIATNECFFGAGIWMPPSDALLKIRQHIYEHPAEWKKASENARFRKRFELHEDRLRSMPRGFPKDAPAADALRLKSFIGGCQIDPGEIERSDLVSSALDAVRDSKSLMSFLCEALGVPY